MEGTLSKANGYIFSLLYVVLVSILFFISSHTFMYDLLDLERKENFKNINTLLNTIDTNLKNLKSITNDYSQWDDTYEFSKNGNIDYIYENFREGTNTLEGLGIDIIIFANNDERVLYSQFRNKILSKEIDFGKLQESIFKTFQNEVNIETLFHYKGNYFYLVKSLILKSDMSGESNSFIYSLKEITSKELQKSTKIYNSLKLQFDKREYNGFQIKKDLIEHALIEIDLQDEVIKNGITLFIHDNYLFTIIASNPREIIIQGKSKILFFNILTGAFIFIIFLFLYKNQKLMESKNKELKKEVERRTQQLERTLEKLEEKNKELNTIANIDPLTDIKNRRCYFLRSEEMLKKSIIMQKEFSVLMLDIDYFKKINDTYGHAVGDRVLIEFCQMVSAILDENAIFGRIGGEEFSISFFNKSLEQVEEIGEKIRVTCEEAIIKAENHEVKFTVSMGLAKHKQLKDIDSILQQADKLLYTAKHEGRNRLIRDR